MSVEKSSEIFPHIKMCTECNKPLGNCKTHVMLNVRSAWETNGSWEDIENTEMCSNEILCSSCAKIFFNNLKNMGKHNV